MTDQQIDAIFEGMPNGPQGFRKEWGYRQFARALLKAQQDEMERRAMEQYRAFVASLSSGEGAA